MKKNQQIPVEVAEKLSLQPKYAYGRGTYGCELLGIQNDVASPQAYVSSSSSCWTLSADVKLHSDLGDEAINYSSDDQTQCFICLDHERDHIFVPCGHMCICTKCTLEYEKGNFYRRECPLCKSAFHSIMKVYKS